MSDSSKRWGFRSVLSLLTSVAITSIALACAWNQWRTIHTRTERHTTTRERLDLLRAELERYKQEKGSYPAKLNELGLKKKEGLPLDEDGTPIDGWERPFQYRVEEGKYHLQSYGADTKPGGHGVYADMDANKTDDWLERPSFTQFMQLPDALSVRIPCFAAGIIAFPICLIEARSRKEQRFGFLKFLGSILVIAFFATLAALMIGALHTVSGGH